jgi:hypothetical protein
MLKAIVVAAKSGETALHKTRLEASGQLVVASEIPGGGLTAGARARSQ